jgi:cytochrome c553
LTSDVAVFAVEQLNKVADGQFKSAYAKSAAATECGACHSSGKKFEQGGWVKGTMDCGLCHDVAPDHFDL